MGRYTNQKRRSGALLEILEGRSLLAENESDERLDDSSNSDEALAYAWAFGKWGAYGGMIASVTLLGIGFVGSYKADRLTGENAISLKEGVVLATAVTGGSVFVTSGLLSGIGVVADLYVAAKKDAFEDKLVYALTGGFLCAALSALDSERATSLLEYGLIMTGRLALMGAFGAGVSAWVVEAVHG